MATPWRTSTQDVMLFAYALLEAGQGVPIHFEGRGSVASHWQELDFWIEQLESAPSLAAKRHERARLAELVESRARFCADGLIGFASSSPAQFAVAPRYLLMWFDQVRANSVAWMREPPNGEYLVRAIREIEQTGISLIDQIVKTSIAIPELDPFVGIRPDGGRDLEFHAEFHSETVKQRLLDHLVGVPDTVIQSAVLQARLWTPPQPPMPDPPGPRRVTRHRAPPPDGSHALSWAAAFGQAFTALQQGRVEEIAPPSVISAAGAIEIAPPPSFADYFVVPNPLTNPCSHERLTDYFHRMGAPNSQRVSAAAARAVRADYDSLHRTFHRFAHAEGVAQPYIPPAMAHLIVESGFTLEEAEGIRAVAGWLHDWVQMHVDAEPDGSRSLPRAAEPLLRSLVTVDVTEVNGKQNFKVHLTQEGWNNPIARMVAHVFDVGEDGISHGPSGRGANEFLSALAAARLMERHRVPPRSIIAVAGAIAATIPFRATRGLDLDEPADGYMGKLAERLASTRLRTEEGEYVASWQEANGMALIALDVALKDIRPFALPDNFAEFFLGGREIKVEELRELRRATSEMITMPELVRAARLTSSSPLLYEWISSGDGPVGAQDIPPFYLLRDEHGRVLGADNSYPPIAVYDAAVRNAQRNTTVAAEAFRAHQLGIVFAQCTATLAGTPNLPVDQVVSAESWLGDISPTALASQNEQAVYDLLAGAGQYETSPVVPANSPISALLYGRSGHRAASQLFRVIDSAYGSASERGVEDPFVQPDLAHMYLSRVRQTVGAQTFALVMYNLSAVARAAGDEARAGLLDSWATNDTFARGGGSRGPHGDERYRTHGGSIPDHAPEYLPATGRGDFAIGGREGIEQTQTIAIGLS